MHALAHEHAHRRALVATAAPQATSSSQLAALQKRLSDMLPAKLLERHPGNALLQLELGAAPQHSTAQHSMAALQHALDSTHWSAVPELGNETPLATVQAAFGSFINWCAASPRAVLCCAVRRHACAGRMQ